MGLFEKYLLIGVLKWLFRWLTSNEKNRKTKVDKLLEEELFVLDYRIKKTVDRLHQKYGA